MNIKRVAVFCGSSAGNNSLYRQEAVKLGEMLAERGIGLVYGGARVGLMGAVANGALKKGGHVTGVFPEFLMELEIAHEQVNELIIVESMHERKTRMNELCDGVIALPGGYGTLEELFEMLTWAQLGLHQKPVALLNTAGFYDDLIRLVNNMTETGFLKPVNRDMLLVDDKTGSLLDGMEDYVAPRVEKWISEDEL